MSDSPASPPQETLPLTLKLRIMGEPVQINASLPAGQIRLDQVLPLLHQIDNAAIDIAVQKSEDEGRPISCCRGCSACCRAQPVPITPAEAYSLWRLVEEMPEPRRSDIRAKFADRARRLREAGLAEVYLDRDPNISEGEARTVARRYFHLGLVCPFLADDGACGIYHDRPFVCRQYLVTSRAELCANPFDNPVEVLPTPIAAAGAFQRVSTDLLRREQFTIPLTLALDFVERHREELEPTFDCKEVVSRCVQEIVSPR
jgi:Fe-S-cluster containining protein